MTNLDTYIEVIKDVWPLLIWAATLQVKVTQHGKNWDLYYYQKRGNKGMRDHSLKGRFRRAVHRFHRNKKHEGNL